MIPVYDEAGADALSDDEAETSDMELLIRTAC
jgi:hypothetical protein